MRALGYAPSALTHPTRYWGVKMSDDTRRRYTSKQMGDACEMLVAAELTLAGVPALKVPDNWPHFDVIAQPFDRRVQRISVKSRTFKKGAAFVEYNTNDEFDWLAIVLLPSSQSPHRQFFIIPRKTADEFARRNNPNTKFADQRYWRIDELGTKFARFENNFLLENGA